MGKHVIVFDLSSFVLEKGNYLNEVNVHMSITFSQ
jgi:hypothetical protein